MPEPLSWNKGLGITRDHFAPLSGGVLDHVLVQQHLVGHLGERRVSHVDLGLPGGAHFVMVHFDLDPALL